MSWVDNIIRDYYASLKEKTVIATDMETGWHTVTTPFPGLFNDLIEIYIKSEKGNIIMSDDGLTLSNLELAGSPIMRSPRRKEWLNMILLNYGVTLNDTELQAIGNEKNSHQKKHDLICAITEISDMAMMAKHNVASLFKEDVKGYLDEQEIIYTPQFIAKGSTGLDFLFDFQIARRDNEVVIKAFNSLNKMNVPSFIFCWEDIKSAREEVSGKELQGLAIINDEGKDIKPEYFEALESKGADYILWSERHQPKALQKLVTNGTSRH